MKGYKHVDLLNSVKTGTDKNPKRKKRGFYPSSQELREQKKELLKKYLQG
jgi:hypothetical protein